ncbi:transcription elongation factor A protein-like 8 isoform X1 [Neomonachus schauinslandi]|uniref:Transcription elongation factor A protein-like 8 isoform X1 n=2 Tax=Neomonachus schauinslandi TaxID=29088 RepID=A0A2Y9H589_NEOSC|nr:transcription elongation factor A protein-like 8 isoform X1 [Neomonachus schauinslandi]
MGGVTEDWSSLMTRPSRDQESTCAEVLIVQGLFPCSSSVLLEKEKSAPDPFRINLFKRNNRKILNMQKSCEENEGKPQNMPKTEADRPSEDVPQEAEGNPQPSEEGVSQEAEGNLRGELTQPGQGFKEDTPVRHLDPEEMIRGVDELERLREEIRRVRNKFVMMHWKQRHSRSRPYPVCFRP